MVDSRWIELWEMDLDVMRRVHPTNLWSNGRRSWVEVSATTRSGRISGGRRAVTQVLEGEMPRKGFVDTNPKWTTTLGTGRISARTPSTQPHQHIAISRRSFDALGGDASTP